MSKFITSFFAVAAFASAAWGQATTPFQPADVFALEAAADPQITPDGRLIAYVRRSNSIETDQTGNSIWLIGSDGHDHRALVDDIPQSSSPRWSPDGTRLAFIAAGEAETAIIVLDIASGTRIKVATLETGASGLAWSPDGRRLAWASFVPAPGVDAAALPDHDPDADWAPGAQIEDRLNFRFDGAGPIPPGSQQIFAADAAGGGVRQLTRGPAPASGDFAWSHDGNAIIFSADRRSGDDNPAPDSELHRLDLLSGAITTLTSRTGPDATPRPSPDGTRLAWLGFDDHRMGYHNTELYIGDATGGSSRSLTAALDRSVANPQWDADGTGIYVQYEDHGRTRVARVSLDGEIETVAEDLIDPAFGRPYTGGSYTVSDDDRIATTAGSPTRPADIAAGPAGGEMVWLTAVNDDLLSHRTLSPAEEITWASPYDGQQIQGWVLYPPGFDPSRQYPMILEIHGGPFSAYGPSFSAELQLMAAAGYVVVYTNPRGSTSYGYEFANLIHHDYPGHDYDDLMGAVDFMLARGFIDENRLFVTGGSGGGVLTAWIVGNTDRFAAAAVIKPVINWTSFVLYSDLPQYFYRYWFATAPWEDPQEYWRRSPLSLVGNVQTPTLMMVGGADLRTPRAETEQYYAALQLRGIPTRLVVIPDAFHGIANSRPSRLLSKVAEILRWFETYDPAQAGAGGNGNEAAD